MELTCNPASCPWWARVIRKTTPRTALGRSGVARHGLFIRWFDGSPGRAPYLAACLLVPRGLSCFTRLPA